MKNNDAAREFSKVGILHVVFATFLLIRPTPYCLYAIFMYAIMLIFTIGNGRRVLADPNHFVNMSRSWTRFVIPPVILFVIAFVVFGILDRWLAFYLFDIASFLAYNVVVLILSLMCPFLSGCLLLSTYGRRKNG